MPRRKAKLDLTLFPFLSVLCGLIAVMVLFMIVTISTRVITSTADPEPGGAPAASGPARPEEGINGDDYRRLDARILELEAVLAERVRAREELRLQVKELAALVEARKLARDTAAADRPAGVRIGEPTPVKMIPFRDPTGPNKTPVFVEVSSSGYVVHPGKAAYPPAALRKDGPGVVGLSPELAKMLEWLAKDRTRYPLLLVHNNGVDAFDALLDHLEDLRDRYPGLDVGWEPFAREWLLDQN